MEKSEMLTLLKERVCQCEKCPDLVASRRQTVFGEGNPNSPIVFCGEAPGKNEDEQGRPFVGRAGELLNIIIEKCGWKREDVYVKCHPDHNRVPTDEESANCRPFLDLQLKVINPKVIVCLGATAAQNLLKTKEAVSKLRNAWYNYNTGTVNAKVRVTFHPAYLLRNPAEKTKVWDDMQAVLAELKNGT